MFVVADSQVRTEFTSLVHNISTGKLSGNGSQQSRTLNSSDFHSVNLLYSNESTSIYPPNYQTLASYMLNLINTDRKDNGVSNVSLSNNFAAQQHAYSMLVNGYFSHWDTQGLTPTIRFLAAGGVGGIAENAGYSATSNTTSAEEASLAALEHGMVYEDEQCCFNGHRNNTLDAFHNFVSLGIAYGGGNLYLVQDFQNVYVTLNHMSLNTTSGVFTFSGTSPYASNISSAFVYYDTIPSPLSVQDLNNVYNGPYSIIPGNETAVENRFSSLEWKTNGTQFLISFSIKSVILQHGNGTGMYTIALSIPIQTGQTIATSSSASLQAGLGTGETGGKVLGPDALYNYLGFLFTQFFGYPINKITQGDD